MQNPKYPRYKVVDQAGRVIGTAVCNLELQDLQKRNIMEGGQYPRYEVVDQDGRVVGFAVCNLELEEPLKPSVRKEQASDGKEAELKDLSE